MNFPFPLRTDALRLHVSVFAFALFSDGSARMAPARALTTYVSSVDVVEDYGLGRRAGQHSGHMGEGLLHL